MASTPEPYVQGQLHGGPHDGETVLLPWARIVLPMARWEGEAMITTDYRLDGPWRGQTIAHYRPDGQGR